MGRRLGLVARIVTAGVLAVALAAVSFHFRDADRAAVPRI